MDLSYSVVTDIAEIANLNKELGIRLRRTFNVKEVREITYPAGHNTFDVYFNASSGQEVPGWVPWTSKDDKFMNFFVRSEPRATSWIQINLQLNFPAKKYNRQMAGAFVRDASGKVFVAHRGKMTKGKAGLPKELVFKEFSANLIKAEDNGRVSTLILIGGLDDPRLAELLTEFGDDARIAATKVGLVASDARAAGVATAKTPSTKTLPKRPIDQLTDYFDECIVDTSSKGYAGGQRVVEHGRIVKALEENRRALGETKRSKAIDLAVLLKGFADLYEVKTSACTTDIYTAVGQLLIHGEGVKETLGLRIRRYLVLPEQPRQAFAHHIGTIGGISIIVYSKVGGKYTFKPV